MRLCTEREWIAACSQGGAYFYGRSRRRGRCNLDGDVSRERPLSYQLRTKCTHNQLFNMLGNVSEWTKEGSVMGGDFSTSESDVTCKYKERRILTSSSEYVGFRCCGNLSVD